MIPTSPPASTLLSAVTSGDADAEQDPYRRRRALDELAAELRAHAVHVTTGEWDPYVRAYLPCTNGLSIDLHTQTGRLVYRYDTERGTVTRPTLDPVGCAAAVATRLRAEQAHRSRDHRAAIDGAI